MSLDRNDDSLYGSWTDMIDIDRKESIIFVVEDSRIIGTYRELFQYYFKNISFEVYNSNQTGNCDSGGKFKLYEEFETNRNQLAEYENRLLIILDTDFSEILEEGEYTTYCKHKNFYYWKKYSFENYFVISDFLVSLLRTTSNIHGKRSFENNFYLWEQSIIRFFKVYLPDIVTLSEFKDYSVIGCEDILSNFKIDNNFTISFKSSDYLEKKIQNVKQQTVMCSTLYDSKLKKNRSKMNQLEKQRGYLSMVPGKLLMQHFLTTVVPFYNRIFACNSNPCKGNNCDTRKCTSRIDVKHNHESYIKLYSNASEHKKSFREDFELIKSKLGIN